MLPYLLSLPALLTCIGILIPFFTALIYSLQRYRLSQPWARKFNWGENYLNFMTDLSFWNTLKVSLTYAFCAVGVELLFGLGIALLLQKRSRFNNFVSIMLLMPLMTAPALAALMWKLMTHPGLGILSSASHTHLTLPTTYPVYISAVAVALKKQKLIALPLIHN